MRAIADARLCETRVSSAWSLLEPISRLDGACGANARLEISRGRDDS